MSKRTPEEKKKLEQEKLQGLLLELLREEENRYCADCDAKGPRWASWSLGVFLCIRCAGIHRNLGVHLSKVKSVNLDTWTPEQVQSMRVLGNCVARAVYEAHIPEGFRRPASDQSMESFIRAKYEHKRYIMKDWQKPKVDIKDLPLYAEMYDTQKGAQKKQTNGSPVVPAARPKVATQSASALPQKNVAVQQPKTVTPTPPPVQNLMDLVDLTAQPHPQQPSVSNHSLAPASAAGGSLKPNTSAPDLMAGLGGGGSSALHDLLGLQGATSVVPPAAVANDDALLLQPSGGGTDAATSAAKSKNDILALYGSTGSLGDGHHQPQAARFGPPPPAQSPLFYPSAATGGFHASPGGLASPGGGGGAANQFGSFQQAPPAMMLYQQQQPVPPGMLPGHHQQQQYSQFSYNQQPMPAAPQHQTPMMTLGGTSIQQQLAALKMNQAATARTPAFRSAAPAVSQSSTLATDLWQ